MNVSVSSLEQVKATVIDLAIRFGPRVLVAILILFVGTMVARTVSRWLLKALHRIELEPPVRQLLARVGWILTFALFLVLALFALVGVGVGALVKNQIVAVSVGGSVTPGKYRGFSWISVIAAATSGCRAHTVAGVPASQRT